MRRIFLIVAGALLSLGVGLVYVEPPRAFPIQAIIADAPQHSTSSCTGQLPGDCVTSALSFYSMMRGYNAAWAAPGTNGSALIKGVGGNVVINVLSTGLIDQTQFATGCGGGSCTRWSIMVNESGGAPQGLVEVSVLGPTIVTSGLTGLPSASFNGTTQFLARAANQGPQSAYSACAIVKYVSGTGIIGAQIESNFYSQFYIGTGGVLSGTIYQDPSNSIGRTSAASAVSTSGYHHVCMTWGGGTTAASIKLFVAGVQVDTTNANSGTFTAPNSNSIALGFGAQSTGSTPAVFFNGEIPEFYEYSTELTPTQVANLCSTMPGGCA